MFFCICNEFIIPLCVLDAEDDEDDEDDDLRTVVTDCETDNNECEGTNIVAQVLSDVNIEDLNILNYKELKFITNNFSEKNKIGEGAFGTVYKPGISDPVVAVKRFKNPVDKQFVTEINTLMRYFMLYSYKLLLLYV